MHDKESFIKEAKAIHGDKYDYSDVEYTRTKDKVNIICPTHGIFPKTPAKHITSKQGCPECNGHIKMTVESFIKRAKLKHGDRYDYSQIKSLKGNKSKVPIICNRGHGLFHQVASSHLGGKGCKECRKELLSAKFRLDQHDFITRVNEIFDGSVDVSAGTYINTTTTMTMYCNIHKRHFPQAPRDTLAGHYGCPDCKSDNKLKQNEDMRLDRDEFLRRTKKQFNGKFDYSEMVYVDYITDIVITCPIHGRFEQTPKLHLKGAGCPKCGIDNGIESRRMTEVEFTERVKDIHGCRYTYNALRFKRITDSIIITCQIHGDFPQSVKSHLNGAGCPDCAIITVANSNRYSTEKFIELAKLIHSDKYTYDKVVYTRSTSNVIIRCTECDSDFPQTPGNHLQGQGCPSCNFGGINLNKSVTIYYIKIYFEGNVFYKIGITNATVAVRFSNDKNLYYKILHTQYFKNGRDASKIETMIKRKYKRYRYSKHDILNTGNTEIYTKDILGLDKDDVFTDMLPCRLYFVEIDTTAMDTKYDKLYKVGISRNPEIHLKHAGISPRFHWQVNCSTRLKAMSIERAILDKYTNNIFNDELVLFSRTDNTEVLTKHILLDDIVDLIDSAV